MTMKRAQVEVYVHYVRRLRLKATSKNVIPAPIFIGIDFSRNP